MNISFVAEPIISVNGFLLGVELLSRFNNHANIPFSPGAVISGWNSEKKSQLLCEQFKAITRKQKWFEENDLFCTVNIDNDMAEFLINNLTLKRKPELMSFVRLEVSECFHGLNYGKSNSQLTSLRKLGHSLWLDDLGAGDANLASLTGGLFDVVKIEHSFFQSEVEKITFECLVKNIQRYCDKIIIEGVENEYFLGKVSNLNIWGMQGHYFKSVAFDDVEKLIQKTKHLQL